MLTQKIGLPSNLFYSTGRYYSLYFSVEEVQKTWWRVVYQRSRVLRKRQKTLREDENGAPNDIQKIVEIYQYRPDHVERYARRVSIGEIENNGYNLNISRYVSTSEDEIQISLEDINQKLMSVNERIKINTDKHNEFLKEIGLKNDEKRR